MPGFTIDLTHYPAEGGLPFLTPANAHEKLTASEFIEGTVVE